MIVGIGNDIVEIERIKMASSRTKTFLDKLLTCVESSRVIKDSKPNMESVAGIFAAKEAVSKALGTGFVTFGLKDIEVLKDEKGKPSVKLYGGAELIAKEMDITHIHVSISHSKTYATAIAIAEKREG